MPYANKNSPEALASRKKASQKHYYLNREYYIDKATSWNKENRDKVNNL